MTGKEITFSFFNFLFFCLNNQSVSRSTTLLAPSFVSIIIIIIIIMYPCVLVSLRLAPEINILFYSLSILYTISPLLFFTFSS